MAGARNWLRIRAADRAIGPTLRRAAQRREASAEAVERAKDYLRDLPNTRVELADAGELTSFEAQAYDFVYALDPGFAALREIRRALKPGGYAWMRLESPAHTRLDLLEFAQSEDFQVLALENTGAHGLWTTWRKQPRGWYAAVQDPRPNAAELPVVIRRITNASSSEPVAPMPRPRFASIAIRAGRLPADAGLHHLRVTVGSSFGTVTYVGPTDGSGYGQELRADLPDLESNRIAAGAVSVLAMEESISAPAALRVIPPGPSVPRLLALSKNVTAHALKLSGNGGNRAPRPNRNLGGRASGERARLRLHRPAGAAVRHRRRNAGGPCSRQTHARNAGGAAQDPSGADRSGSVDRFQG